ncbi:MAG: InlB B-repeat-containing protein [Chitinispirillaceae bacterium]|nr:InlB B-repeat-containing protein [Chitinispirillaceae bacterium]
MRSSHHSNVFVLMLRLASYFALVGAIFLLCNLPPDPDNPSNSAVFLSLKSSNGLTNRDIIVDSIGREVEISVIYFLPSYIKSTSLQIVSSEGVTEFDTTLVSVSNGSMDTLRVNKVMQFPGEKKVIAYALIADNFTSSDTALITVLGNLSANQPPSWDDTDTLKVKVLSGTRYTLNLEDTSSDPDGDFLTYTLLDGMPLKDTIIEKNYSYTTTITDTASFIVKIIAEDQGNLSDTLIVQLTVEGSPVLTEDIVKPVIKLQLPLKDSTTVSSSTCTVQVICTDASRISVVTCRIGTRTCEVTRTLDSIYSAVVDNLPIGMFTEVIFTAADSSVNQNRDSLGFYIKYDPTLADLKPPLIVLASPERDSVKISSSSFTMEITCSDQSGVGSVVCTVGTRDVAVTRSLGNDFSASITGLTAGVNLIKFTAKDSTLQGNTISKTFTLIYDPTMNDNVAPAVTLKAPTANESRVVSLPLTIQIVCKDDNGIAEVTCTHKNAGVAVINTDDSLYTATIASLTAGKCDTALFIVADNSPQKNKKTFAVTVRYNRPPEALVVTSPAADAAGVSRTPTFSWTGGTDPDNDTVFFRVIYGSSAAEMTAQTDIVTSPTVTVHTAKALAANTRYFYQVTGWTKEYIDTVRSQIGQFTTIAENGVTYGANGATGSVPVDINGYAPGSTVTVKGNTGTPPLAKTGHTFNGWTTTADGSGKVYKTSGSDTLTMPSSPLTLYAKWVVDTFKVTFIVTGTEVFTSQKIAFNSTATAPAQVPVRTGFAFDGWYSASDGSGAPYNFTALVTADKAIYAKWIPLYSVTYNANGAEGSPPVDEKSYCSTDEVIVKTVGGLSRGGFTFGGWNTESNGGGDTYQPNGNFEMGAGNVTLYAVWTRNTCTVTFNSLGATIQPIPSTIDVDKNALLGSLPEPPSKSNYQFAGWYTQENGSGERIIASSIISKNITVYAYWVDYNSVVDKDENVYSTVQIFTQVWIVENYRCTKYNDGSSIQYDTSSVNWSGGTTGKYCYFNNIDQQDSVKKYGALYNWGSVNSGKIAPVGWHVPTKAEWETLLDYLIKSGYNWDNTDVDNKVAKSLAARTDWAESEFEGTPGNWLPTNNRTGFTGIPSGYRYDYLGMFQNRGYSAIWWTSTSDETATTKAYSCNLDNKTENLGINNSIDIGCGLSIRLIKD